MTDVIHAEPLKAQVGGSHYKRLVIQPVEFALQNRWDFAAASALKYLTRYREKAGVEDLKKARHFVQLRAPHAQSLVPIIRPAITMHHYIVSNEIQAMDINALLGLETLVMTSPFTHVEPAGPLNVNVLSEALIAEIDLLIRWADENS